LADDDGVGLPSETGRSDGPGHVLVDRLSRQLGATRNSLFSAQGIRPQPTEFAYAVRIDFRKNQRIPQYSRFFSLLQGILE
jgi:hypothetical protein